MVAQPPEDQQVEAQSPEEQASEEELPEEQQALTRLPFGILRPRLSLGSLFRFDPFGESRKQNAAHSIICGKSAPGKATWVQVLVSD